MYRWLDFRTWDANHVQMAAAGMKAHAKIRFNIYVNIGAIVVAEYFLWVLWKKLSITTLGFDLHKVVRLHLAQGGVYLW